MNRREILEEVANIVSGERLETHGDPQEQLELEGQIMQKLITHSGWSLLTPVEQSALRAIILKLTRMVTGKPQDDHWRDVLGYAVIAAEARYNETEDKELEALAQGFRVDQPGGQGFKPQAYGGQSPQSRVNYTCVQK